MLAHASMRKHAPARPRDADRRPPPRAQARDWPESPPACWHARRPRAPARPRDADRRPPPRPQAPHWPERGWKGPFPGDLGGGRRQEGACRAARAFVFFQQLETSFRCLFDVFIIHHHDTL